jgi:hypothetical protein
MQLILERTENHLPVLSTSLSRFSVTLPSPPNGRYRYGLCDRGGGPEAVHRQSALALPTGHSHARALRTVHK